MGRKGQALVEFIIILPIFLLIVLSAIDFGNILYQKYRLENSLDYIMELHYQNDEAKIISYTNNEKIVFNYDEQANKITIKKKITTYAPGLKLIFPDPYFIEAEGNLYE